MKSSNAKRKTFRWFSFFESRVVSCLTRAFHFAQLSAEQCSPSVLSLTAFFAKSSKTRIAISRNTCGHSGSAGSIQSAAQVTARQAASGRRAHHICKSEIVPRLFSKRACAEMRFIGRSTSMRRFGYWTRLNLQPLF